jgi:uncharacterized protein
MNLWLVFLTGLTTGGISCVAIQGGLLASAIANQKSKFPFLQIGSFLIAKILIHTIFGAFLGYIGSAFQINLGVTLAFQGLAALYLLASALHMLDVHPAFRYVVIKPPKFLYRLTKNTSKLSDWFAPALLGLMTIFIPCGVTQTMEITAMTSGSPVTGALTMLFFTLGTAPLFILIGLFTSSISTMWQKRMNAIAAGLIIMLSLSSFNGILTVLDSPFSLNGFVNTYNKVRSYENGQVAGTKTPEVINGKQNVVINVTPRGYQPNLVQVKKGIPVQLTLNTTENYTCANFFVFKAFNINARLQPTDSQTFEFTPNKTGRFSFSCSMGMYSGVVEVI